MIEVGMQLIKNRFAVSVAIAVILSVSIIIASTGVVLLWGIPYIESRKAEENQQKMQMQFTQLNEIFYGIGYKPAGSISESMDVGEGEIRVEDQTDRLIISYSLNKSYNFTVSGLDTFNSNSFTLDMRDGKVTRAEVYWLDEDATDWGFDQCLLRGAKVLLADGSYKDVENLKVGDKVICYDEQRKSIGMGEIKDIVIYPIRDRLYITINHNLRVTLDHLFYTLYPDGKWAWKRAKELEIGDKLLSSSLGYVEIVSLDLGKVSDSVYDIRVEPFHNYFVLCGQDAILVHNYDEYYESYPTSTGKLWNDWIDGRNAFASDDRYARGSTRERQDYGNFNFEIPDDALIDGIAVEVEGYAVYEEGTTATFGIALSWDGGKSFTGWKSQEWDSREVFRISGGPDDDWGREWSPSDFSNENFLVLLYTADKAAYYIDCIRVKVYVSFSSPNNPPVISDEDPENGSVGVELRPTCSVYVTDPDGDRLTVYWYENSTGRWELKQTNRTLSGTTVRWKFENAADYGTKYWWKVVVTDESNEATAAIFHFTTLTEENNPPDRPTLPKPEDGAKDVDINPTLSVYVYDIDDDTLTVEFYGGLHGGTLPELIGIAENVPSGGRASVVWSNLDYNTTYYWYAVASDGQFENTSDTWIFTTRSQPSNQPPSCELSADPTSGNAPLEVTFYMSARDSDGKIVSWDLDVDNDGEAEYRGTGEPPSSQRHTYTEPGDYTANLTVVDDDGAIGYATVDITVKSGGGGGNPELYFHPTSHDFGEVYKGFKGSTTFEIKNNGTGTLKFSLTTSSSWIAVSPTEGKLTEDESITVTVTIDTTDLDEGNYTGYVYIRTDTEDKGVFVIYVCVVKGPITVTLPRAGEKFRVGTSIAIKWTNISGIGYPLTINIVNRSDNTILGQIVVDSYQGSKGYEEWYVPLNLVNVGTHQLPVYINISNQSGLYGLSSTFYILERFDWIEYNETLFPQNNKFTASRSLSGCAVIELYDDPPGKRAKEPFGRIWIFDNDALVYIINTMVGSYKVVYEMGSVIREMPNGYAYMWSGPKLIDKNGVISFLLDQLSSMHPSSISGKCRIDAYTGVSSQRENSRVYNLSIQMYGTYSGVFLEYLVENYNFVRSSTNQNLIFYDGETGWSRWLIINHAVIRFVLGV